MSGRTPKRSRVADERGAHRPTRHLGKALIALVLMVSTAACSASTDPSDAESCSELVDAAVQAVEEARDEAIGTTQADFDLLSPEASPILRDLQATRDAIETRSGDLGCDEESSDEYTERVLELAPLSGGGLRVLEYAFFPPF